MEEGRRSEMVSGAKIIGVIIIGGVLISVFRKWIFIPIIIVILLFIIRLLADLWWWGKDKGSW